MKLTKPLFLLPLFIAVSMTSCVGPGFPLDGFLSSVGISNGNYNSVPNNYSGDSYYYQGRYYTGGNYETGRYYYRGRSYDNRYYHNNRYYYGGRYQYQNGSRQGGARYEDNGNGYRTQYPQRQYYRTY